MIRLEDVTFGYDKNRTVIDHVSFHIAEGETVGLIGANGAGKSTLMKLLLGLESGSGKIMISGTEVRKDTLAAIRRTCGYVFQNSDFQMFMPTVIEDFLFGPLNYGVSREEAEKKADEVLEALGISNLKNAYSHTLSGGEKKMAAIGTVLCMEPEVILFDEPTASLDPYNRRLVIRQIKGLESTKIITSHDLDMILETCGRVIMLARGKVAADGDPRVILRDEALLNACRLELPYTFRRLQ